MSFSVSRPISRSLFMPLYAMDNLGCFPELRRQGRDSNQSPHLSQMLRMCGATFPLPRTPSQSTLPLQSLQSRQIIYQITGF